jgi:2',3'-cyclic-nucleotide 2'-phosphodiesterase (5'-nucleotidase family)
VVGPEGIKVAILGIGNHRIPNYELPSNIPGLTFTNPIAKAQELATTLDPTNDVVIALTHIGFAEDPKSVEVDTNVDVNMAMTVSGLDTIIGGHSHTNPATGFGAYKYLPTIIASPDNTPVTVSQAYRYNNTLGTIVIGVRPDGNGGWEVVSNTGRYIAIAKDVAEDATINNLIQPYVDLLKSYNETEIGQTTVPIDALKAYTEETNGANMQADASVHELESNGIAVDFHLSGAMSNRKVPTAADAVFPYTLKVADMFTLMPYENSLVVLNMNGPQLKAVLERAYRNYYYYKYVPGYGGYSYYTTCMLTINALGQITYNDLYPAAYDPNQNYVVSLKFGDQEVDFNDASKYYRVSTVNYLAAGSCNFNNGGVSLWPLNQIANDTQYYVRDAVINYVSAMGTVSPAIEGRLQFIYDVEPPVITITSPEAKTYVHTDKVPVSFSAVDVGDAGLLSVTGAVDGIPVVNGQELDLLMLPLGSHTLTVTAVDKAGNTSTASVSFNVVATMRSLMIATSRFFKGGQINNPLNFISLMHKLLFSNMLREQGKIRQANDFLQFYINEVKVFSGKTIDPAAAAILIADAQWILDNQANGAQGGSITGPEPLVDEDFIGKWEIYLPFTSTR